MESILGLILRQVARICVFCLWKRRLFDRASLMEIRVLGGVLGICLSGIFFSYGRGQESIAPAYASDEVIEAATTELYESEIKLAFESYCVACHNADDMESGVNLERFDGRFRDRDLAAWSHILKQIESGSMPPEEEEQLSRLERKQVVQAISKCMELARSRAPKNNGTVRRLTVAQYRNTLKQVLGVDEDFTEVLPPDGVSRDGFSNDESVLGLTPLQLEAYLSIAEQALDACLVDDEPPVIQNFKVHLGKDINPDASDDDLILGAGSLLLPNSDVLIREVRADKPFAFTPFSMKKSFRFHEGYQGNSTVRGWREFAGIHHAVFACMRGSRGYPLGLAYESAKDGLLLRPAIPSAEIFGESTTMGPKANFKISARELPEHGRFRIKVVAKKYRDFMLLEASDARMHVKFSKPISAAIYGGKNSKAKLRMDDGRSIRSALVNGACEIEVPKAGIYLVELKCRELGLEQGDDEDGNQNDKKAPQATNVTLSLGATTTTRQVQLFNERNLKPFMNRYGLDPKRTEPHDFFEKFAVIRLEKGRSQVAVKCEHDELLCIDGVELTPIKPQESLAKDFVDFEKRTPQLSLLVGLRRDCGHTLKLVANQAVDNWDEDTFEFEGAIDDFPRPFIQKDNDNYLAGMREFAVRNEYTSDKPAPRMLIKSVEFEGPYYDMWPPKSHRSVFLPRLPGEIEGQGYAKRILQNFLPKAYRRPVKEEEAETLLAVWERAYGESDDFNLSMKETLLVALTSAQFLLLTEESKSSSLEELGEYELASKLSYFLWNEGPDEQLLEAAARNSLHKEVQAHVDRMVRDPRFERCVEQFTREWLSLHKFDTVEIDRKKFPKLQRDVRRELAKEPVAFLSYSFRNNLPVRHLVDSRFVVANDVTAKYYGLAETFSGFDFVPVQHERADLGGLLTQASVLSGLSDGREANPVKRGAWFARKIIAEPPADPPPNVPELEESADGTLSLRERLERHRNQKGCANCHQGIDPWGLPFEQYDAAGVFDPNKEAEPSSLPDGKSVRDIEELKDYLLKDRSDQVVFSFLKHLSIYAAGRQLGYNELRRLREQAGRLASTTECRMTDLIHVVIQSDVFLMK